MKLIKIQSLYYCHELWIWLYENPDKEKYDWPGRHKYGCMKYDCPCCQYARIEIDASCSMCPLVGLWGSKYTACDRYESPYYQWKYARTDTLRKETALQIIRGCEQAIRAMKKKVVVYEPVELVA